MSRIATSLSVLTIALLWSSAAVFAQTTVRLEFQGMVEPRRVVKVANQVNGIIARVHVTAGEKVTSGDLLFSIEDSGFQIAVTTARAALAEAQARLDLATDIASRKRQLAARGTGPEAVARQSELEAGIAQTAVQRAKSELAAADLELKRSAIRASISGTMGPPRVAPGEFVEAVAGSVLGEIAQLDPILVAYSVPYADRQKALSASGTNSVTELLKRVRLMIKLPSGEAYPLDGRAQFESARIDPETGMLTTWGEFPNPDGILVPGLKVTVISRLVAEASKARD